MGQARRAFTLGNGPETMIEQPNLVLPRVILRYAKLQMTSLVPPPYRFAAFLPHPPLSQIRVCGPRVATRVGSAAMSQDRSETEGPSPQDDGSGDVVVQYVVVRRDLIDTWPTGSVVAQGCHASVAAVWAYRDDPHTIRYCSPENIDSMHKVSLEVKGETQMLNLSEKLKAGGIAHKLWIEQPENIPTCLATKPYPKSAVASFFKKLKLCK